MTNSFGRLGQAGIKQKTLNCVAGAVIAVIGVGLVFGVTSMNRSVRREQDAMQRQAEFKQLGLTLAQASDFLTDEARKYSVTADRAHLDAYWHEIDVTKRREKVVAKLKSLGAPQAELDLIAEAKANSDALVATESRSQRLVLEASGVAEAAMPPAIAAFPLEPADEALPREAKLTLASKIMFDGKYEADKAVIVAPVQKFQKMMNSRAARDVRAAQQGTRRAQTLLTFLAVAVTLVVGGLLYAVQRMLGSVITRYATSLHDRDPQDLTFRVHPAGTYELRALATEFNCQFDQVATIVDQVANSSDTLAAASEELSAVSAQMASNAESASSQAAAVSSAAEQVSANIASVATASEEMTSSIGEIATNASDAANIAVDAVQTTTVATEAIARLGESSKEINDVVHVISSIAEQTNLLALNATIEAARAGEAGKGFAVVANEVKELAQASAKSTSSIAERVATIQADTAAAVEAIDRIGETIARVNAATTSIASAVEEQTATTNEIGRSVSEAAQNSTEIATTITGVASAADETTSGAANTEASATELARMASDLRSLVGQFRR
jgi:methyl-accepting chemotaxis protein